MSSEDDCPPATAWTEDDENSGWSDRDCRIRALYNSGFSSRRISEILTAEGMPLGKTGVALRVKELRLDPDNEMRTSASRKGGVPKYKQKWYKIISELKIAVEEYTRRMGFKPSLRTMFYDFVDRKLVGENEYQTFGSRATDSRIGYIGQDGELLLPQLPINCFVDESRKTVGHYDDSEPTEMEPPSDIEDPEDYIDYEIDNLKRAVRYYKGVGEEGTDGKRGGFWYNQPEYVAVWNEKVDLTQGFEKMLQSVHVDITGNKGYSSLTFLHECTKDLKEIIERKELDQDDVTILYCGDWDPSGENIIRYMRRRLKLLGLEKIHFIPVAVTPEQIDEYSLPLLPVEQTKMKMTEKGLVKKNPNPNMAEFIRRHGYKATHLNAFFTEARYPNFQEILLEKVLEHWDEGIYNQMVEDFEVVADAPERLTNEELTTGRKTMRDKITEAFTVGWEEEEEKKDVYDSNND